MRSLALAATACLGHLVLVVPSAGFVKPPAGTVLADYDVRTARRAPEVDGPGALDRSDVLLESNQAIPSVDHSAVKPLPGQSDALKRLRAQFAPALRVELQRSNNLPRQLHAWGKPLSLPSTGDPIVTARNFLKEWVDLFHLSSREVDSLLVVRNYATAEGSDFGWRTVWLGQAVDGILLEQGAVRFALDRQGRVVWVSVGEIRPGLTVDTVAQLPVDDAARAAARYVGVPIDANLVPLTPLGSGQSVFLSPGFRDAITVSPVLFPMGDGGGVLAWRVLLKPEPKGAPALYAVTVDARSGKLLARANLTRYVTNQGLVFDGRYPSTVPSPPFPPGVAQSRVDFGYRWPSTAGHTVPAPYGLYDQTFGNNVDAKEDWDDDDEIVVGARANGGPLQEFFFPFTDAFATSTGATTADKIVDARKDIGSATVNLFWQINNWHDYSYRLGFTEAAGNFQKDNFSRGGCGGDGIYADAQDAATRQPPFLNNANIDVIPEPFNCASIPNATRMQMYLWDRTAARDGDFDNGIIIHEYHHGISIRLVGGPYTNCMSGVQSGAIGEGGGDFEAASYLDYPVIGAYVFNDPVKGIRAYPMDANPRTYADLCLPGGCQVHADGEIHASVLWDQRQRMGQAVTEQLAMDAYKLTPCSPTFLDYRDALTIADELRYGGSHLCDIWDVSFARGMGFDAEGDDEGYRLPDWIFNHPKCSGWAHPRYHAHTTSDLALGNGDGLFGVGETIDLMVELQNFDGGLDATGVSATVTTTTPGITMVTGTRNYPSLPVAGRANPVLPFQFLVGPTFACGTPIEFRVAISWAPGLSRADNFREEQGSVAGVVLFRADAESAPLALTAPMAVSAAQNHSPGGMNSYHTLAGCYAGDEPTCTGAGPCNDVCPGVMLPLIQLPTLQTVTLSFWARYNNEFNWDGVYVQVSDDGGLSWATVPSSSYNGRLPSQGGQFGCSSSANEPGLTGPPANDALTPWSRFEASLARWAGQTVLIRIVEHHDSCIYFEGAYIDDIELQVRNCLAVPFVSSFLSARTEDDSIDAACTDNDAYPDPGETVDVTLSVTNSGTLTAANLTGALTCSNPAISVLTTGPQAYGSLNPGQTGLAVFRYRVNNPGPACFDSADFTLALSANGGSYSDSLAFSVVLRGDSGSASWRDTFEGGNPPWTPTLGPIGTIQDWALRELDCLIVGGNRWFWATNIGMVKTVCTTGEPDYSDDSDSILTSPLIDLGAAGMLLTRASWSAFSVGTSVGSGFVEFAIDHDNDGAFTPVWNASDLGITDPTNQGYIVDLLENPMRTSLPAATTSRFVKVRFRLRSTAPDPGSTTSTRGMLLDDFRLEWQLCDLNACAPGLTSGSGVVPMQTRPGAADLPVSPVAGVPSGASSP